MHYPPHVVPYIEYNHLMKVKFFPRNQEGNLTTCLSLLTFKINFVWQTHWTVAKSMHFQDQPSMIKSRIYGKIREQMIQYNYYLLLSPRKYAHHWTLACRLRLGKLAERLMVNESQGSHFIPTTTSFLKFCQRMSWAPQERELTLDLNTSNLTSYQFKTLHDTFPFI